MKIFLCALCALCVLNVLSAAQSAAAPTLKVAAASDLQAVLPAITTEFEKATGHAVALTFGSSGNFFTQIRNGAPFDLFLSADVEYPRHLEQSGQADKGSLYEYASGRIVLWTRNDSKIDLSSGLAVLAGADIRRIAIANPDHAPYGRAAIAALQHQGIYDRVQSKLVRGENVSQAAQFVESGNAEVGVIALSLALSPALKSAGRYIDVPESFHPPIEQAAVVLAMSPQKDIAKEFLQFLRRSDTVRILESYGFALPHPSVR
jgi:molybdate transport system substrate-binding protein